MSCADIQLRCLTHHAEKLVQKMKSLIFFYKRVISWGQGLSVGNQTVVVSMHTIAYYTSNSYMDILLTRPHLMQTHISLI